MLWLRMSVFERPIIAAVFMERSGRNATIALRSKLQRIGFEISGTLFF